MHRNLNLLLFFATTTRVLCFYNLCHSPKNAILSDEECADLFFEPSEKETELGRVGLDLRNLTLHVTPAENSWNDAFLRISVYNDKSKNLCSKLPQVDVKDYCVVFASSNETFLLEYKAEKLPEANSRKFLFELPKLGSPIFPYIDFTDTSRLILKAQKYASNANITGYKIEAFKDKHNKTSLQDLKIFTSDTEILYELYTYNDEGSYYFIISPMCSDDLCFQIPTPKFYIGRKSTRLVIGIVGASFILPFVLFVFHILTKKYPLEESQDGEEKIAVVYKSSNCKKHNEIVVTLAALLEKFSKKQSDVVVVDAGKPPRKFPEKRESLTSTNRVVYVAPPRSDSDSFAIDKGMADKEICVVVFDYCGDKLPQFFENRKVYRLFEDFDKFLNDLGVSEPYGNSLYTELRRKTEEAKLETETVPKIVVTEEPQEHESLL